MVVRRFLRVYGAVAVLCFNLFAQSQFAILKRLTDSVSTERLTLHVDRLQYAGGYRSRANFTPGLDSAVAYVQQAFKSMPGISSVTLDTLYVPSAAPPFNTKPMFNVIASIRGSNISSGRIVIGAHIDACANRSAGWEQQWNTMHAPGADDNASGVAAVLELAQLMSDTLFGFTSVNPIDFVAFGVEETGPSYSGFLYGSAQYAQRARANGVNIAGMVSLDMIGFNDLNTMYLNIVADGQSQWLGNHVAAMNDTFHLGITLNTPPFPSGRWSDHASFWDQQFPAVCLIECAPPTITNSFYNANPYYHTTADTLGTLNMNLVKKGTQLTLASVATLGSAATDVKENRNAVPLAFALNQNYPNPFNPATEIDFSIHAAGYTSLIVYDMLGSVVSTLVGETKTAGAYTIRFDGSSLPSGIYFYRLMSGGAAITKKMVLMK